jgi:alkylhydroperoxidase family enzyme
MSDITQARRDLVARILRGTGRASQAERQAAFDNAGVAEPLRALVDKVARQAHRVTDEDIASARRAGFTEDQLFELIVCAAIGQATRQYDSAARALDSASRKD